MFDSIRILCSLQISTSFSRNRLHSSRCAFPMSQVQLDSIQTTCRHSYARIPLPQFCAANDLRRLTSPDQQQRDPDLDYMQPLLSLLHLGAWTASAVAALTIRSHQSHSSAAYFVSFSQSHVLDHNHSIARALCSHHFRFFNGHLADLLIVNHFRLTLYY